MTATNIIHVNKNNFNQEVISSSVPVLIDFWAPWCGPCLAVAPVLEKLGDKYSGKVKIAKVNVDDESALATQFRVMSIPTLVLVKDGKVFNQMIGLRSSQELENMINKAI